MPEQRWGYNSWEDYYIPGTKTVRNKFRAPDKPYGEPNPDILHAKEEAASFLRMHELRLRPITGNFDYEHMQAIHGYIFQDVYDWAGVPRVGPHGWMTKEGPNVLRPDDPDNPTMAFTYYPGTEIMHEDARRLAEKNYLRGLEKPEFVRARFYSQATGSNNRLADVLDQAIMPLN